MKTVFLFLLVLRLALGAGAVRAATTLTVATVADGTGTSPLTLRAAINEANNDTSAAHFPYIINLPTGTYTLTQREIPIGPGVGSGLGNNLLIIGSGTAASTVIRQGDGTSRVFDLDPLGRGNAIFAFANVTIAGGNDTFADAYGLQGDGGGGILTGDAGAGGDALNLTNCVFMNNNATGAGGGSQGGAGVSSDGGTVVMVGCVFTNNTLLSGATNIFLGAGVYFIADDLGDKLTVVNSVFQNNRITGNSRQAALGGALAVDNGNTLPVLKLTGCVFTGNSVTSTAPGGPDAGGGALYLGPGSSNTLSGCTFSNNQANGTMNLGGAILCVEGTTNLIEYCRFVKNTVAAGGAGTQIHLNAAQGPFNANDNWWGSDNGPASGAIAGTNTTIAKTPSVWLFLTNTVSAAMDEIGSQDTLTASFLTDSAGNPIAPASLTALVGVPIAFGGTDGSISAAQGVIQPAGTATATFTGTVPGSGSGSATVDGVTSTSSISVFNVTPPILTGVKLPGRGVIEFGFTNKPEGTFTVLSSTNLSLPRTNWTVVGVATNTAPGVFQFTSQPTTNDPRRFYLIRSP